MIARTALAGPVFLVAAVGGMVVVVVVRRSLATAGQPSSSQTSESWPQRDLFEDEAMVDRLKSDRGWAAQGELGNLPRGSAVRGPERAREGEGSRRPSVRTLR